MVTLYLAAGAVFFAACIAYYRGGFGIAALLGLVFFGLTARVVLATMNPVAACVWLTLLCVAPSLYLLVHYVDAKKGLFYLPTIYSIPIAFLSALALWCVAGLGLVL